MNQLTLPVAASELITSIRLRFGLGRTEFANLLGLGSTGERTVRGWETGDHVPSLKKLADINDLESRLLDVSKRAPFKDRRSAWKFDFIDLFAGIGGIRLPFQRLGGRCVFTSEWDKFAQKTYLANFGEVPAGDITKISAKDIPRHDVLLAGFPCQAFSQAGLKRGFQDTRGTMFFEIQRILEEHRPKAFLLENVKQLKGHDKGRTLNTILDILEGRHSEQLPDDIGISDETRRALESKLNYKVFHKILRAADYGVPQNRERIFLVGFDRDHFGRELTEAPSFFKWPEPRKKSRKVGDILEDLSQLPAESDRFTISDKLWSGHQRRKLEHRAKGNGFGYSVFTKDSDYTNTISARYYKDGSEILIDQSEVGKNPRKLTPRECARLQGFPDKFVVDEVSQGQIYKQFGNSVCMKVVEQIAKSMLDTMDSDKNSSTLTPR